MSDPVITTPVYRSGTIHPAPPRGLPAPAPPPRWLACYGPRAGPRRDGVLGAYDTETEAGERVVGFNEFHAANGLVTAWVEEDSEAGGQQQEDIGR